MFASELSFSARFDLTIPFLRPINPSNKIPLIDQLEHTSDVFAIAAKLLELQKAIDHIDRSIAKLDSVLAVSQPPFAIGSIRLMFEKVAEGDGYILRPFPVVMTFIRKNFRRFERMPLTRLQNRAKSINEFSSNYAATFRTLEHANKLLTRRASIMKTIGSFKMSCVASSRNLAEYETTIDEFIAEQIDFVLPYDKSNT